MSVTRAKFRCTEKVEAYGDQFQVSLQPVTGGSAENEQFYKWTPGGQIHLATINRDAARQFEVGREYYVDFTPAG